MRDDQKRQVIAAEMAGEHKVREHMARRESARYLAAQEESYIEWYCQRSAEQRVRDAAFIQAVGHENWMNARRKASRANNKLQSKYGVRVGGGVAWTGQPPPVPQVIVPERNPPPALDSDRRAAGRQLAIDAQILELQSFARRYQLNAQERRALCDSIGGVVSSVDSLAETLCRAQAIGAESGLPLRQSPVSSDGKLQDKEA